jgi:hypothetical protein
MTETRRRMAELRTARHTKRSIRDGRPFHPDAPHGTRGAYSNYGCRCLECRAANTLAMRMYRRRDGPVSLHPPA